MKNGNGNRNGNETGPNHDSQSDDEYRQKIGALFVEHYSAVYQVARGIVADPLLAEDVTQLTFLHVFEKLYTFEGRSSLRTWIIAIARNQAIATLRGLGGKVFCELDDSHAETLHTTTDGVSLEWFSGVDVEKVLKNRNVDPGDILILHLKYVEGFSQEEIASMYGITRGGTKVKISRATKRAKEALLEAGIHP